MARSFQDKPNLNVAKFHLGIASQWGMVDRY